MSTGSTEKRHLQTVLMNFQLGSERMRLDELLVCRGLYATRSRARDAIERGTVRADGVVASRPGANIGEDAEITVDDPARHYVSRAALKLIAGLDYFNLDPAGRQALDIGASTGGFTQVLLEHGAAHVIAVDVGHGQMDVTLRANPCVTCLEGVNARYLDAAHLGGRNLNFIVSDVSFISLKLALPPALNLASAGTEGLFLVKPQFEAGREAIGKGGLLRNRSDGDRIASELGDWLDAFRGWRAIGTCPSPIRGGEGNHEYLLAGIKDR